MSRKLLGERRAMRGSAGKRALIVVENLSVPFDRRVWREAKALREAGWQVSVICPRSPQDDGLVCGDSTAGDYEVLDGVHIYRFPLRFAQSGFGAYLREYVTALLASTRLSLRVLREQGFDVLQFCNPPDLFFPLGTVYRLLGKRVIFDHHDLFPEAVDFRFRGTTGNLMSRLALACEWLTFHMATVVMSTNESYRQIALKRGGVKPERVFVVRNGPELATFQPLPPDPALKNGRSHLVCYLGVMGAEDGIEPMMEAIRYFVCDLGRQDVQFVLIGDGCMRSHAVEYVNRWDLGPQVFLPGRISEMEVRRYLSTADVCLSPDPYTPLNDLSTMNKIMEYMVMAKPLVSFDLKEARFSAQEAAVYVPCGDARAFGQAVVDLLDDPTRRQRMGEFGRQRVLEHLAWEHQKERLLAAYSAVMNVQQ